MKLSELVATSQRVTATRSRRAKLGHLATLLRALSPTEVAIATSYLIGDLPQGKIGIGYATVSEVAASFGVAFGPVSGGAATADRARPADPADDVGADSAATSADLELVEVDRAFSHLAALAGPGSSRERSRLLTALLASTTPLARDFLLRLVTGELRQGALAGLMTEAVAQANELPLAMVRRAAMLAGDLPAVAAVARTSGAAGLAAFRLELFRPLQPMLADTAGSVEEALATISRGAKADASAAEAADDSALAAYHLASFEWKLDGARVQIHKQGDVVRIYTRHLNEVTAALPDVVAAARALPVGDGIFDGEAIALRPDGRPLPFQVTMRRFGRKLDVAAAVGDLPLSTFVFDLLYADGVDWLDRPAAERFAALAALLPTANAVPRLVTADPDEADRFYAEAVARGHEGLMVKALDVPYEAGNRGIGWLKLKPAHTLDLVVLAVEWGSGRRQGWLSNLHLGARDPASESFVMLGKTFKGLTDELLSWQTRELLARETHRDAWTIYVRPELVVEIALNDVQESPHYPAGMALRFARVKRYRPDKPAAEADTVDTVRKLFATKR